MNTQRMATWSGTSSTANAQIAVKGWNEGRAAAADKQTGLESFIITVSATALK